MTRRSFGAAAIIACVATIGSAQPPKDPVDAYHTETFFVAAMCDAKVRMVMVQSQLGDYGAALKDANSCISEGKASTKQLLDKALSRVRKPAAKEALKTYHVAFVTRLEGLMPGTDERKLAYQTRQLDLESRQKAAWTRFEVER